MSKSMKSAIINAGSFVIASLVIIGLFNIDGVAPFANHMSTHFTGYAFYLFWFCAGLILIVTPLAVALTIEDAMGDSGTRVGHAFSNAMDNARDSWSSLIVVIILGFSLTSLSVWGTITIISG